MTRIPVYNSIKTVPDAHKLQNKSSRAPSKKSGFQPLVSRRHIDRVRDRILIYTSIS